MIVENWLNIRFRAAALLFTSALMFGCGASSEDGPTDDGEGLTKAEARERAGKGDETGTDVCAENDWYEDGECDIFCTRPDPDCGDVLATPVLTLIPSETKRFVFTWDEVPYATEYRLLEAANSDSDYTVLTTLERDRLSYELTGVPLYDRAYATYVVQACSELGCSESEPVEIRDLNYSANLLTDAIGYLKASNAGASDSFGYSMDISADGTTLAIGAPGEASGSGGVDADPMDNSSPRSGAVYIFSNVDGAWRQSAYLKAPDAADNGGFGNALSISADGTTLAVGGDMNWDFPDIEEESRSGAVFVFQQDSGKWSEQATLRAEAADAGDWFGTSISLSDDGRTLAVGAQHEDGDATQVDGDQSNNSSVWSGAAYVFELEGDRWNQKSYLKASDASRWSLFGASVSLSGDASTLVVGAYGDGNTNTETQFPRDATGAAYVFTHSEGSWNEAAKITSSRALHPGDLFGSSVAVSQNGDVVAVAAVNDNGNGSDRETLSGAVYTFAREGDTWNMLQGFKPEVRERNLGFGSSLAITADGGTIVVGATGESSRRTGINNYEGSRKSTESGAAYVFKQEEDGIWRESSYLKSKSPAEKQGFGNSITISADGQTLAIGAMNETGAAPEHSGAAYLF